LYVGVIIYCTKFSVVLRRWVKRERTLYFYI